MKNRLLRVRELLKRELSEAMQKELDFGGVLVTVNDVDVTPDLRQGHVFVGIVGGDENQRREAMQKLHRNRVMLQKMVSKRVVLKYFPHLHFKEDDSVARGANVLTIMDELEEGVEGGDPPTDSTSSPRTGSGQAAEVGGEAQ